MVDFFSFLSKSEKLSFSGLVLELPRESCSWLCAAEDPGEFLIPL